MAPKQPPVVFSSWIVQLIFFLLLKSTIKISLCLIRGLGVDDSILAPSWDPEQVGYGNWRSTCFLLIPFFFQQDVDIGEHVAGQKSNTSRLASMVVHHLNKHPLLCTLFIYSGNDDNMTYKGLLELPTTDIYRMIGQKFNLSFSLNLFTFCTLITHSSAGSWLVTLTT